MKRAVLLLTLVGAVAAAATAAAFVGLFSPAGATASGDTNVLPPTTTS